MATMVLSRTLRDAPNGQPIGIIANGGVKVEIVETRDLGDAGTWTKVRLVATPNTPVGWVSSSAVDEAGAPMQALIDKIQFAKECWRQALFYGLDAHYLTAAGEMRSRVSTGVADGMTGPFGLTQAQWDGLRSNEEFGLDFETGDIDNWRVQTIVAGLMTLQAQNALMPSPDHPRPTVIKLYVAQFGPANATDAQLAILSDELKTALDSVRPAVIEAGGDILDGVTSAVRPTNGSAAKLNPGSLPAGPQAKANANLIVSKFHAAGYGTIQQIAAVANAIAESGLTATAHATRGEDSCGLFQLNRKGGLGKGFSVVQLFDPSFNIDIIVKETKRFDAFRDAKSLFDAVNVFVRKVEKPNRPEDQVRIRTKIAESLANSRSLLT